MSTEAIDTRDHVFHRPTCETWVVAYVKGDRLAWCGWPEGEAELADCQLVRKATEPERTALLGGCGRTTICDQTTTAAARAKTRASFFG